MTITDQIKMLNRKVMQNKAQYFYSSTKDVKISDDDKISDGHISAEDYLT